MEPRRRVVRSVALTGSVVLVGGFIGYASGRVGFLAGSKANHVFKTVDSLGTAPHAHPDSTRPAPPAQTEPE
jgi:hypothetical protein